MPDPVTTLTLAVLTLAGIAAAVLAVAQLVRPAARPASGPAAVAAPPVSHDRRQDLLIGLGAAGSGLLFGYRGLVVYRQWQPLEAHVDGLLLIAAIFGGSLLLLESRARLPGLNAFALPLLVVILAWAICASEWT